MFCYFLMLWFVCCCCCGRSCQPPPSGSASSNAMQVTHEPMMKQLQAAMRLLWRAESCGLVSSMILHPHTFSLSPALPLPMSIELVLISFSGLIHKNEIVETSTIKSILHLQISIIGRQQLWKFMVGFSTGINEKTNHMLPVATMAVVKQVMVVMDTVKKKTVYLVSLGHLFICGVPNDYLTLPSSPMEPTWPAAVFEKKKSNYKHRNIPT